MSWKKALIFHLDVRENSLNLEYQNLAIQIHPHLLLHQMMIIIQRIQVVKF